MSEIQAIKTELQMSKLRERMYRKLPYQQADTLLDAHRTARAEFEECEADVDAEIIRITKWAFSATRCAASTKEQMCRRIADSKIETLGQRLGDAIAALVKAQNAIAEA